MRMKIILSLLLIAVASAVAISLSQSTFAQSWPGSPYQISTITSSNVTSSTSNQTTGFFGTGFIVEYVKAALKPYRQIPQATLFTMGIAIVLGLTSSSAAKLLVDYDMIRKNNREFQSWRKEIDAAKKANDNQTVSKLMKKQQAMTKAQAKASMEQFKVTAVTFVPFLLLWYLLNAVFAGQVVAVSPWPLPLAGVNLNFVSWYFLSSFGVNFPMMRLFGIGMGEN
ncbi:MAG: EMC3/TMCO1 family protein [Candidatus Bathyarchaeia archaeon]